MFPWRRTVLHRRCIVNLADKAFDAVIYARRGPLLVLRDARMLTPGSSPQPLDGEVVVERCRVEFIQVAG